MYNSGPTSSTLYKCYTNGTESVALRFIESAALEIRQYTTGLGGALNISHFVTCLYGTVLEVNYLFHAESARNYLFQKYSCPHPGNLMVAP